MHHGQASMEYMFLVAFSLLAVGIVWSVSATQTQDMLWELKVATAKGALEKITHAADGVCIQGPPAQNRIHVEIPDDTNAVYLEGQYVSIELWWKGELRNITRSSITNITGNVNPGRGVHTLVITGQNPVTVSEA